MLRKISYTFISFLLMHIFCVSTAFAQYGTDVILLNGSDNVAVVRSSGIGKNKKEAIEEAKKAAIYVYLHNGVVGINEDKPLLGYNPSDKAKKYVDGILESGRYNVFCGNAEFQKDLSGKASSGYKACVNLELYTKLLYNDLKNGGYIALNASQTNLNEIQSMIQIPTIMVVPYCKAGENFQTKLQSSTNIRMAVSKVNQGFIGKDVETKDIEQMIRIAESQEAMNYGMSLNDLVLNDCGADVAVYVDMTPSTNENGTTISLTLKAVDVSTGNTYATRSEVTPRKRASVDLICAALVDAIIDDFLKQITSAFSRKTGSGNNISITLNIAATSMVTFDYEMSDYTPLRDALHLWVRKNAVDGRFHLKGSTKTMMMFDGIQIPNKDPETGEHLDVNDFSLKLYRYLRSQGLQIERDVNNNRITITIL